MNFNQDAWLSLDSNLMESVKRIMSTPLDVQHDVQIPAETQSFIKIRSRDDSGNKNVFGRYSSPIYHLPSDPNSSLLETQSLILNCFCWWAHDQAANSSTQNTVSKDDGLSYQHFETYKQLKKIAKESNPDISKEEIYEELLKPFRYEKLKTWDRAQSRFRISYICRYEDCDKEFTKTWNLLDHVRMHEGIKPFACQFWDKTFTQKGNLKKHNIIQHSTKSLKERKKFRCKVCNKRYTERYNLVVSNYFGLDGIRYFK